MRLLVVEDDADLNRQLVSALGDAGYAVDTAFDGEEGYFLGDTEPYDLIILDIGLPKMDGLSVLEQWRRSDRNMPVIILTARDRWSDKVAGMDAGADDYVAKPFHMEELLARVRAQVRRASGDRMRTDPVGYEICPGYVRRGHHKAYVARVPAFGLSHASPRQGGFTHRTRRASLRAGL